MEILTVMEKIMEGTDFTKNIKNFILNMLNLRNLLNIQVETLGRLWIYEYEVHGRIP